MKKRIAGVLAVLMVLVMGTTTAFAATSPTTEDAVVESLNEAVTSVSVSTGSVTTSSVSTETYESAVTQKENSDDTILGMVDISYSGTIPTGGVSVTLSISGVSSGDSVYVLHYKSSGSWEKLTPTSVSTGKVTVKMTSFSPVIVVKRSSSSGTTTVTDNSTTDNSTTTSTTTTTNSNNTTGDTQSQTNSQTNSNDQDNTQSNSQTNNQSNPVTVTQTVNVYSNSNSDDTDSSSSASATSTSEASTSTTGSSSTSSSTVSTTAPKTGASLPALPFVAVFAAAGMAVCGKKARKGNN